MALENGVNTNAEESTTPSQTFDGTHQMGELD